MQTADQARREINSGADDPFLVTALKDLDIR